MVLLTIVKSIFVLREQMKQMSSLFRYLNENWSQTGANFCHLENRNC